MTDSHPTNGYDGDQVQGFLDDIAKLDDEKLTLKGEYMQACQGPNARIRDVMNRVREADINMVAFREQLKKNREERARQARIAAMEMDDRDAYELLEQALGDFGNTPLGRSALDRARPREDQTLEELHS